MKKYLVSAAVAAFAGPVAAGGPVAVPVEDPVVVATVAPSFDWTGFYAGLHYGQGDLSAAGEADSDFYGVQAGYLRDFGAFVAGGELSYSSGEIEGGGATADIDTTRLKLIGGYDAGRFLPYLFIGVADLELSAGGTSLSDTMTGYGLGGKFALGANGQHVLGLEYLTEEADNFADSGTTLENDEITFSYNFRF
jgi:outer membrane immunogenic protein